MVVVLFIVLLEILKTLLQLRSFCRRPDTRITRTVASRGDQNDRKEAVVAVLLVVDDSSAISSNTKSSKGLQQQQRLFCP